MKEGNVIAEIEGVIERKITKFARGNRTLYVNSFNMLLQIINTPGFIFASQTLVHDYQFEARVTAVESFHVVKEVTLVFTQTIADITFKYTKQAAMGVL